MTFRLQVTGYRLQGLLYHVLRIACYVRRVVVRVLRSTFQASGLKFVVSPLPLVLLLCLVSCGHKTPVRPPEWIVPEAIGDLALDVDDKKNAVVLQMGTSARVR